MATRCPLCKQVLPQGVSPHKLHERIAELSAPALSAEKRRWELSVKARIDEAREAAARQAARKAGDDLERAQRRIAAMEKERTKEIARIEKKYEEKAEQIAKSQITRLKIEMEQRAKKQVQDAIRTATNRQQNEVDKVKNDRERDKLKHEVERVRLQTQLESLSRKLEKQSGEALGEEGEVDLYTQLRQAFPEDHIERIKRGVSGADIVQNIRTGTQTVGKIVFESKNVSTWQNSFLAQAKRHQVQYETPYVVIVSRVFPSKNKNLCVVKNIPVVSPKMAVALAEIIRESAVEIGKLRVSDVSRDKKAQQIFDYIISNTFATRFKSLAEGVDALREHQRKEKDWHANSWRNQSKLHEGLEGRHREIDVDLKSILKGAGEKKPIAMAARA